MPVRSWLLSLLCLCGASVVAAEESTASGWQQDFHLYLLAPTIEGTTGIGSLDTDVDIDSGTVFDSLEGAFLAMYAAERNGWGVFLDIVYMDLEADITGGRELVTGTVGNKQFTGMAAATWRLNPEWQFHGGFMYNRIELSIETQGPVTPRSGERTESWWEPYVGARFSRELGARWGLEALGTVGGFGVGSELTWSASAVVGY